MDDRCNWFSKVWQGSLLLFFCSTLLSACMVGPNFKQPDAPQVTRYNALRLPTKTARTPGNRNAGKSQFYAYGCDIPADWWKIFHSEEINMLVENGMQNNQNLAAAKAALRQAQETLYQQIGNLMFPAVNGNLGGQRQKFAGSSIGDGFPSTIFNVFNATASLTYNLDVFGGSRRQLEGLLAQVDYQQFQLLAVYLTLTTNIVTTAFTIASYEEQIRATKSLIISQQGQLDILQKQLRFGGIAAPTVLAQQTLVEQTRATLPPLQKSLSQARHALATLIGVFPDTPMPLINLNKLYLPAAIPVSLPSYLVRQRPDVRASEALLHVASAQIGVATANLFPSFNISANYGFSGPYIPSLFSGINRTWAYGMTLTQPLFHGGALFAARRAAIAAFDQAMAQYKQTLLEAFQNTADALRAIETDARTFRAAKAAETAAYRAVRINRMQYRDGGVSFLELLNAEQQYQQTKISSIQAQATRYIDTAALYQALGGGWWNRQCKYCPDSVNPTKSTLCCPA